MNIIIRQLYNRSLYNTYSIKCFSSIYTRSRKEESKVDPKIIEERKKIFNKRTHHRHISLDRKYYPTDDIEEQDRRELVDYQKKIVYDKQYLRIMNDWQLNLEKSRVRKAKIKQKFEEYVKPEQQEEKFVVHNPEKTITIPALDENIFAVVYFKGFQHKVTKDDIISMEKIDNMNPGDTFVFDKVLLVGTNEYTSIGRPYVSSCKVLATIEENALTDKVIVFKKKRRKGYQRNNGHRQEMTQIRILKVIHTPNEAVLDNYHSL